MTTPPLDQPRGLGRRYAPDPRDRRYTLTPDKLKRIPFATEAGKLGRKLPWKRGPVLDQGATSECTVFAAAAFLQCAPQLHRAGLTWPRDRFTAIYREAQTIDEWPGENYEGTSERAVLKILQRDGVIGEYLWVADEDIAREYLMTRGTLPLGSDWFYPMFFPSAKGAYVEPAGEWVGGHETVVRWYYGPKHYKYPDTYELINSWGPWGDNGLFRLKADAFRYLFLHLNGDLCSPQEVTARKLVTPSAPAQNTTERTATSPLSDVNYALSLNFPENDLEREFLARVSKRLTSHGERNARITVHRELREEGKV